MGKNLRFKIDQRSIVSIIVSCNLFLDWKLLTLYRDSELETLFLFFCLKIDKTLFYLCTL